MILAGQGLLLSEATEELLEFIRVLRIPVVTSPNGKGSIDERHELSMGPIGRNGPYQANEATRNADVILALGCSFDDRTTSAWIEGYTLKVPPTRSFRSTSIRPRSAATTRRRSASSAT